MNRDVFEELVVVKRSGQRVNFNSYKIAVAIKNAFDAVPAKYDEKNINKVYEDVLKHIELNYKSRRTINVEDIQDIIENELKKQKYLDIYDEFSQYRKKRAESRQAFTIKQQHKFAKAMEKIKEDNLLGTDNSLKPGQILQEYGNTVLNEFVKSYIVDNKYLRMYEEGNIYINSVSNASLGRFMDVNLIINNKLECSNSLNELLKYLFDCIDEVDGEIHISAIDKLLSKCVYKKFRLLLIEYINNYLDVVGFNNYINMDVLTNVVNKSDYINLYDNLSNLALNERVKNIFDKAYNDSLEKIKNELYSEMSCFIFSLNDCKRKFSFSLSVGYSSIENLISNILIKIIENNERFDYVSLIYKVKTIDDNNLNNIFELIQKNKNNALENCNLVENDDYEYFSNGIRIYDNYNDTNYSNGRMIVSKTSINMARIGLIYANKSRKEFYSGLEEMVELVKNELLLMFEIIGNKSKENYQVLFDDNIVTDEKLESGGKIRKVIKNSNLLIGLVGLKECIEVLEEDNDKQYKLLCDILEFLNKKCQTFREETKLNFYLFEPNDDNSRKYFMGLDKSIYGIKKGITDKDEYDLVINSKCLKNDYERIGKVLNNLSGGNIMIKEINNHLTYKKFVIYLQDIIDNKIGFVSFRRNTG